MAQLSSPNQESLRGFSIGNILTRRDTASSAGSDQYNPMPAGHWEFDFHGSCPRCRHQHDAVKMKVDISPDPTRVSRVRCKKCEEPLVAFGGRNCTRISLQSANSTEPDPAERQVRNALINMVKSATTIASPTLAGIPEISSSDASREYTTPSTSRNRPRPSTIPERVTFHVAAIQDSRQAPNAAKSLPTTESTTSTADGDALERSPSVRRRFIARLSLLRRAPMRQHLDILRGSDIPVRSMEQHLITIPRIGILPDPVPDPPNQNSRGDNIPVQSIVPVQVQGSTTERPTLNPEAAEFIARFQNDSLTTMSEQERVAWVRSNLTAFYSHRTNVGTAYEGTQANPHELPPPHVPNIRQNYPPSLDFFGLGSHPGLGSHHGIFDGLWASDLANHPGPPSSSSTSKRTSEASTAVEDDRVASNPPTSLTEFLQRGRRGSGSPRPLSVHSTLRSWQQLRQSPAEARYSLDSTATGVALRNNSISGARNSNRWSGGSILGLTHLSMSQTSLPQRVPEAPDVNNTSDGALPLAPPSSVREH